MQKGGILTASKPIPFVEWDSEIQERHLPILAMLNDLADNYEVSKSENTLSLPHEAIVGLTEAQANVIGLPPSLPYGLDIRANGMIQQNDFSLSISWVTAGGMKEHGLIRKGAFITDGQTQYRIPSPLYEIVVASEALSKGHEINDAARFLAINALQEHLPKSDDETANNIKADKYFSSIRILHASAFSLQIPTGGDGFQFDPVLFTRKAVGRAEEDGRQLDEAESLLTPSLQSIFADDRFKRSAVAKDCYAIDSGTYVYLDPDLKLALEVVRRMQTSSADDRRKFIRSPQKIIKEQIDLDATFLGVDRLFVETEQYAENVIGLGLWQPPIIPWIVSQPNNWLPEKFGLKIGEHYVQFEPDEIAPTRDALTDRLKAFEFGEAEQQPFIHNGFQFPTSLDGLQEALDSLEKLSGVAVAHVKSNSSPKLTSEQRSELESRAPQFLLVDDNLTDLRYQVAPRKRLSTEKRDLPIVLKSTLKTHQTYGFNWLVDSWSNGAPGVLLADDMGLGKTLQSLTFLAWLKERKGEGHSRCKEPILIVAPTALLSNWQREIAIHLREPYLGEVFEAYGSNLTSAKSGTKNDLATGKVNLSRDRLRKSDIILTTYETYRDYHHSFGGIRFSAAILDECQKIKNPRSQVNRAIASMNAEFVIAMTGTPVENAMEDLWTILDRAWPGFLGDLKSFSTSFPSDNQEALAGLTQRLKGPAAAEVPSPIMLRRMKEDISDELPRKILHPNPAESVDVHQLLKNDLVVGHMPPEQARAYSELVTQAMEESPPPKLFIIHKLRGISLHPMDPDTILGDANFQSYDRYISDSARLTKCIQILDQIKAKNEKALVFIETIAMQSLMAEIIKKRYGLSKRPDIINGKTGTKRIQLFVDEFQADPHFDVMILSPKVGGVGLTLTAANHVIHLSRWWNPAVEDQSTDRVYRIGQKKDVHVYYPMAIHPDTHIQAKSFDIELNSLLERKRKLSRDMLIPAESSSDTDSLFDEVVGFPRTVSQITLEELERMNAIQFEEWVLLSARRNGYLTDATKLSWDQGADGIITHKKTGQKFILQCKHSNRPKYDDYKIIEDLLKARAAYDNVGDAGLVALTNTSFSAGLIRKLNEHKIQYFDRERICEWPLL